MITPAQFVTNFPAFSDPNSFPTASIQFWLNQAYSQLNAYALCDQLDYAAQLFTAHKLVLAYNASQVTASGGGGGQSAGMVAEKSVGGASIGYDTGSTAMPGAGEYNATAWGQMLWPILRGSLAGPIYVPASYDVTAQSCFGYGFGRRRGFLGF